VKTNITEPEMQRDYIIWRDTRKDYEEKKIYLVMRSISFVAMTLFAVAPFTGPAAPALIIPAMVMSSFVTAYYLYHHRERIGAGLESLAKNIKEGAQVIKEGVREGVKKGANALASSYGPNIYKLKS
jgi:hypothetical protein